MSFRDTVKKYKKTAIALGTLAVVVVVGLLAGVTPADLWACAATLDVQSPACLLVSQ